MAIDTNDITIPSEEISSKLDREYQEFLSFKQARAGGAAPTGAGGMLGTSFEEDTSVPQPEQPQGSVSVPFYVAEKFNVEKRPDGSLRLTPHAHVMKDVEKSVTRGLANIGKYLPAGSEESDAAHALKDAMDSVFDILGDTFGDESEGAAKSRLETALAGLAATYWYQYAITRFEAQTWAERDAARGNNPADLSARDPRYAAKGERMKKFARLGSALYLALPARVQAELAKTLPARAAQQLYNAASWQAKQLASQQAGPTSPKGDASAVALAVDLLDAA